MNKTEELNKLFDDWIKAFPHYKGKFKKDGIVHEERYEKQRVKILFLMKEPNDPEQTEGDYREWWKEKVKYSFSIRMAEWTYGILNNFPNISSLPTATEQDKLIELMSSIAFMNLKKSGGGASANHTEIREVIEKEREFILKEIKIISPDFIIGGVGEKSFWYKLFPQIEFKPTGHDIDIAKVGGSTVIDYYHPSYRGSRAMSYYLLEKVIDSQCLA